MVRSQLLVAFALLALVALCTPSKAYKASLSNRPLAHRSLAQDIASSLRPPSESSSDALNIHYRGNTQGDGEAGVLGERNERAVAGSQAAEIGVSVTATASSTNGTFEADVCSRIGAITTSVQLTGYGSLNLAMPSCLGTLGPNIATVSLALIAVNNISVLPPSVTAFSASSSSFGAAASGSLTGTGFDSNGLVVWDDFWTSMPNITSLNIGTSSLYGPLPTNLPKTVTLFILLTTGISGQIPSSIFSSVLSSASLLHSFTFSITNTPISGTIPENLFAGSAPPQLVALSILLIQGSLSGSIPPLLLQPLHGKLLSTFKLDLSANDLTGSLPANFFPSNMITPDCSFFWSVATNGLTGSIPSSIFSNITGFNNFEFHAQTNKLSGSLPNVLFSDGWTVSPSNNGFVLELSSNELTGSIPATLLTGGLTQNATFVAIKLHLTNNSINGVVPPLFVYTSPPQPAARKRESDDATDASDVEDALSPDTGSTTVSISAQTNLFIYFDLNLLEGPLPNDFFPSTGLTSPVAQVIFDLSTNPINGTIPSSLFVPIPDTSTTSGLTVYLDTSLISGSPPPNCFTKTVTRWYLNDMRLNGTIPTAWGGCTGLQYVNVASNTNLTGAIPPALLTVPNLSLYASNTGLNGTLSAVASTFTALDLSKTNVDFCASSTSPVSGSSVVCTMTNTNVCNCAWQYTRCTTQCPNTIPAPISVPSPTPFPPTTSAPPFTTPSSSTPFPPPTSAPPSPTSTVPPLSGCPSNTRPSPQFTCINGIWTAPAVNTTTLTVPSGAGTIVVNGNLTSMTVVIQGVGSTINVTGSITNLTTITVELTPQQIAALSGSKTLQILINTNNGSTSDLSSVGIDARATSGCKKVKAEKVVLDEGHTLGAFFTVDKSGCNTWWIILVSVIVAVIVVAAVVLVLLAVFYKPFRHAVRPYADSENRRAGIL